MNVCVCFFYQYMNAVNSPVLSIIVSRRFAQLISMDMQQQLFKMLEMGSGTLAQSKTPNKGNLITCVIVAWVL